MIIFEILFGLLVLAGLYGLVHLGVFTIRRMSLGSRKIHQRLQKPKLVEAMDRIVQQGDWVWESVRGSKITLKHTSSPMEFTVSLENQREWTLTSFQLHAPQLLPVELHISPVASPSHTAPLFFPQIKQPSSDDHGLEVFELPEEETMTIPLAETLPPTDELPVDWGVHFTHFPDAPIKLWKAAFAPGYYLEGIEAEILSAWDVSGGARLRELMSKFQIRVEYSELQLKEPGMMLDPLQLEIVFHRMLELASLLHVEHQEIPQRLLGNVKEHPFGPVRQRSLELLQMIAPTSPKAREACEFAMEHHPLQGKITAAVFLGEIQANYLQDVLLQQSDIPERTEESILDHLQATLPQETMQPFLEAFVEQIRPIQHLENDEDFSYRDSMQRERRLLKRLARCGKREALPFLREYMETVLKFLQTNSLFSLVLAFAEIGEDVVEPDLLRCLDYPSSNIQCATAQILGHIGTPAAIDALAKRLEQTTIPKEIEIFKSALKELQVRWSHLDAGRLTLIVPEDKGNLSMVQPVDEKNSGALSLSSRLSPHEIAAESDLTEPVEKTAKSSG